MSDCEETLTNDVPQDGAKSKSYKGGVVDKIIEFKKKHQHANSGEIQLSMFGFGRLLVVPTGLQGTWSKQSHLVINNL